MFENIPLSQGGYSRVKAAVRFYTFGPKQRGTDKDMFWLLQTLDKFKVAENRSFDRISVAHAIIQNPVSADMVLQDTYSCTASDRSGTRVTTRLAKLVFQGLERMVKAGAVRIKYITKLWGTESTPQAPPRKKCKIKKRKIKQSTVRALFDTKESTLTPASTQWKINHGDVLSMVSCAAGIIFTEHLLNTSSDVAKILNAPEKFQNHIGKEMETEYTKLLRGTGTYICSIYITNKIV